MEKQLPLDAKLVHEFTIRADRFLLALDYFEFMRHAVDPDKVPRPWGTEGFSESLCLAVAQKLLSNRLADFPLKTVFRGFRDPPLTERQETLRRFLQPNADCLKDLELNIGILLPWCFGYMFWVVEGDAAVMILRAFAFGEITEADLR